MVAKKQTTKNKEMEIWHKVTAITEKIDKLCLEENVMKKNHAQDMIKINKEILKLQRQIIKLYK